ncbi:MAG: 23S rRNA (adenine(2503)-C(2))-methyltransferase RlmN [Magnetococcus sp. DMHC-6]
MSIQLIGLTRPEMVDFVATLGEKPFRARQLWSWIYVKLAPDVGAMTDLPKEFRARLQADAPPFWPQMAEHRVAVDGTEKWLLEYPDGVHVETVYIPEVNRGTVCLSTQVGCSLSCPFCQTGTMGLTRNLTAAEIIGQVLFARAFLAPQGKRVTNVVIMGMGEPLYNYDAVVRAVRVLLDDCGLAIGTRRITLSTAGVAPRLGAIGRDLGVNLAISLHSVRNDVRDKIIPLNRKYNLESIQQAIRTYPLKKGRCFTWEYLLLDGVNDSLEDAQELVAFLKGIPSKVNLLGFNTWPGSPFKPSPPEVMLRFQEVLWRAKLVTVLRESRGADIAAACGQLKWMANASAKDGNILS